jgi:hypothetical protein
MMIKRQSALIKGHRDNLDRYHRLLRARLTDLERAYINRRIAEEQAAIDRLLAEMIAMRREDEPLNDGAIAAATMARKADGHPRP